MGSPFHWLAVSAWGLTFSVYALRLVNEERRSVLSGDSGPLPRRGLFFLSFAFYMSILIIRMLMFPFALAFALILTYYTYDCWWLYLYLASRTLVLVSAWLVVVALAVGLMAKRLRNVLWTAEHMYKEYEEPLQARTDRDEAPPTNPASRVPPPASA